MWFTNFLESVPKIFKLLKKGVKTCNQNNHVSKLTKILNKSINILIFKTLLLITYY